jgi:hypothetical protein
MGFFKCSESKYEYKRTTISLYVPKHNMDHAPMPLSKLYSGKISKLNKQKKNLGAERKIKVGDEVRRVDFAKRKGNLAKGYKQS